MKDRMTHRIGVLSDTHDLLRPEVTDALKGCGAIFHAGDVGGREILDALGQIAPVYAVRGNCDTGWGQSLPETLLVELYGLRIFMVHDKAQVPEGLEADLVICGHSHRYEERRADGKLWLNPGSCGPARFRLPVTMAVLEAEEGGPVRAMRIEFPRAGKRQALFSKDAPAAAGKKSKDTSAAAGKKSKDTSAAAGKKSKNTLAAAGKKFSGDGDTAGRKKSLAGADVPGREKLPADMSAVIEAVVRDADRGKSVRQTAKRNGISEELAEQICRMYFTHPGVDTDGIMNRLGL